MSYIIWFYDLQRMLISSSGKHEKVVSLGLQMLEAKEDAKVREHLMRSLLSLGLFSQARKVATVGIQKHSKT